MSLKKDRWTWLMGLITLALVLGLMRSCGINRAKIRAEKAEARNEILERDLKKATQDYTAEKSDWAKREATLQGNIDSANSVIAKLEGSVLESEGRRQAAEDTLASAKTDAERVPILESLYKEAKIEIFTLKRQIEEKDKIIFSLNEKYDGEKKLRLAAESLIVEKDRLISGLREERDAQNKYIGKLELRSKIKTWGGFGGSILSFLLGLALGS